MQESILHYLLNISMGLSPSFPQQRLAYDHTLNWCLCWNHISNKLFSSPYSRVYFLVKKKKIKIRNVGVAMGGWECTYTYIHTYTYTWTHNYYIRKSSKLGEFLNVLREAMAGWKDNRLMLTTSFVSPGSKQTMKRQANLVNPTHIANLWAN